MKKLFGKYLIERNVVSENELVVALIEQAKSSPQLSEIVFQNGLLTATEMLAVFDKQTTLGVDFLQAARNLGLWTDDIDSKVRSIFDKERRLIGEVLISKGFVKPEVLVDILDDYINNPEDETSEAEVPVKKVEAVKYVAPVEVPTVPEIHIPDISLSFEEESQATVEEKDPIVLEIEDFFNSDNLNLVTSDLNEETIPDQCRAMVKMVRGKVYLAGLKRMNTILHVQEEMLKRLDENDQENLTKLKQIITDSFALTWDVVEAVLKDMKEDDFLKSPDRASSVSFLLKKLNDFQRKAS